MAKTTLYTLRDADVKEVRRVINRSSTNGEMFEAIANLLSNAEHNADTRPVVSTRDLKVRTGCTENTVDDLYQTIQNYLADGYSLDELVIEGVTE